MTAELVVMGGGRMGEALVRGLLHSGWAPATDLVVVDASPARRAELASTLGAEHPGLTFADRPPAAAGAVVAVKPVDVAAACAALRSSGARRVLSIAAGVRTDRLEEWLAGAPGDDPGVPTAPAVLRAMPNTPALIGAGASAVAAGTSAGPADLAWAEGILAAVGTVATVAEGLLDAVTGLSGSGPAYVFLLAEALIDGGVLVGLPRTVAHQLAVQTLLGAARLLAESGDGPEVLRAMVTSPGGTTAAGLRALEAGGVRSAVLDAVSAASRRAGELGA